MKRTLTIACRYTAITAVILGIAYPLLITAIAQVVAAGRANGQLIQRDGAIVGSAIIGQPFSGPGYFHGRPSAAGSGYDASASSGSNLGPTNKSLVDRVSSSVKSESDAAGTPLPIDLVTASGSGLDPDISPAAASYQADRIARERHLADADVLELIRRHTAGRQLGLLGEPRVNVLALNLDLDGRPLAAVK